jgi:glycosyltransferase involved in cell wall biosynthesis
LAFFVSLILCTRDRASALEQTFDALEALNVPLGWQLETIVVDNASTDQTAQLVRERAAKPSKLNLRSVFEARKGKGHALNTGIASAQGAVLLFTDDDVRPATDWLERLASPLFRGEADAVGGKILLGPELTRPWLTENYQRWLAWCGYPLTEPLELIGANMGLGRSAIARVPGFDPALGPGAAGLGEDTLFGWQLVRAHARIKFISDAVVVHHPGQARLHRSSWLGMAKSHGRKDAYLRHHWKHEAIAFPRLKSAWLQIKLAVRRRIDPPGPMDSEGCAWWEMSYVGDIEMCRAYRQERAKPRNYPKPPKSEPHGPVTGGC